MIADVIVPLRQCSELSTFRLELALQTRMGEGLPLRDYGLRSVNGRTPMEAARWWPADTKARLSGSLCFPRVIQ